MIEVFIPMGIIVGIIVGSTLLIVGLTNILDTWNRKKKKWGIVKLNVGALFVLGGIGLAAVEGVKQDEFRVRCLSYGGVSYNDVCYKDGAKVDLDEEG